ncbi:hypothetical protein ACVGWN_00785, partial [Enterobacter hormaechei]
DGAGYGERVAAVAPSVKMPGGGVALTRRPKKTNQKQPPGTGIPHPPKKIIKKKKKTPPNKKIKNRIY